MLTRLEVDGFKNLLGFAVDFGPYTCIAGPNAVGKSNVFDVIEFLSALANRTFIEAMQSLRGDAGQDPGNLATNFWRNPDGTCRDLRIAAECLVDKTVTDDFGAENEARSTFLRYEIRLRYVAPDEDDAYRSPYGAIRLLSETLEYIRKGDVLERLPWLKNRKQFRDSVFKNERTGKAYVSTKERDGRTVIAVHQDGGSRGPENTSPADSAPRSVISTATTVDRPTLLAFRRELQSWKKLALEPAAMRTPDRFTDPDRIASNGAHLARTIYRLKRTLGDDVTAQIAERANDLVDVRHLDVKADTSRDSLTLFGNVGSVDLDLPAKSLSDGTLRFLVLSTLLADPRATGLICMEEPENGIHPAKVTGMVRLLRDLAVDITQPVSDDNPLRQVIVNTHSPAVVACQEDGELLEAHSIATRSDHGPIRVLRLLPLRHTWRDSRSPQFTLSKASIAEYLSLPPDAPQFSTLDLLPQRSAA